jgi:O-antigen ligase
MPKLKCHKAAFLLFAGFFGFTCLSAVNSINLPESLYESLRVFLMAVYFVIAFTIVDKDVLAKSLTLLALGLSLYGVYKYFGWYVNVEVWPDTPNEVTGTMCNKNLWSESLLLLLPFCVYNIKHWKTISVIASVLLVCNIFALFTRNAILGLVVYLVIVSAFSKYRWAAWWYILLGCLFLQFLQPDMLTNAIASLLQRCEVWKQTVKIALSHPWMGIGAGNWSIVIPEYAPYINVKGAFETVFYQRPHNDFLWVLSEIGIFGFLCYLGIFILTIYHGIKQKSLLILTLISGCILGAFFSFPKERVFPTMILILVFAMSLPRTNLIEFKKNQFVIPILFLALTCFTVRHYQENQLRIYHKSGRPPVTSVFSTLDFTSTPLDLHIAMGQYSRGDIYCATKSLEKAYKANPNHIHVLNGLGTCMAAQNKKQQAIGYFNQALEIRPDTDVVKRNIERLKNEMGK